MPPGRRGPPNRKPKMQIQAALVESPGGAFTVGDVELEAPRPDELVVKMRAAGICHTDLSLRGRWPGERMPMVSDTRAPGW
jgi:aryl-alcohol dehydrogenase